MTHPFEISGLGKAPFKCLGMRSNKFTPGGLMGHLHSKPGGTCAHCGTGILYEFMIESSDGKKFVVGSSCVEKTDPVLYRQLKSIRREIERQKRAEQRKIDRAERQKQWDAPKLKMIENGIMPFGKHIGMPIASLEDHYVKWLCQNNDSGAVSKALMDALAQRLNQILISEEEAKAKTRYVGAIGEKLRGLEVTILYKRYFEPRFYGAAGSRLIVMKDQFGDKFSAFYSGSEDFPDGAKVTINATVKDHKEYNGEKQTQLTRIKKVQ